jgi:hypothetical protein
MALRCSFRSKVALIILTAGVPRLLDACNEHRTMRIVFNAPVTLPDVALAPGTYVFELANPCGDPTIVRVLSADRSTVYFSGFTRAVPRPAGRRQQRVSFGEARAGRPVPIATWYPVGDSSGRRFIYRERNGQSNSS